MNKILRVYYDIRRFVLDIKYLPAEIKYMYQRVKYGVSDKDIWSLDSYLCKVISRGADVLSKRCVGCPSELFDNNAEKGEACHKWSGILAEIKDGFDAGAVMTKGDYYFDEKDEPKSKEEQDKAYNELEVKYKKGFRLFRKYFFNLWD